MEELLKELEELKQKNIDIVKKIADIEKKIEKKKDKTGRWKPEYGEVYWRLETDSTIARDRWNDHNVDYFRYSIGNCFKTEEDAEFIKEKLKVIAELKEFEESKYREWDGKNEHYFFYYEYVTKEIHMSYNSDCKSKKIYFESKEKARQAIVSIGEDRIKKYYLEVEE